MGYTAWSRNDGASHSAVETTNAAAASTAVGGAGVRTILAASLVGTAIEYFDFWVYATAAALVFGTAFFPKGEPGTQQFEALATFAIAYLARPFGAALFGHFGDRIGRKATLIASPLVMGISTVLIGCLPTYASIGWWAPAALCLLRFGQGIGIGGELGGAMLLAVENAPAERRSLFGAVPFFGVSAGALLANLCFLAMSVALTPQSFQNWGWRLPFLASAVLIVFGLYVRLKLVETPAFVAAITKAPPERIPFATLMSRHKRSVLLGALVATVMYALPYVFGVFAIGYGTKTLGYSYPVFLTMGCIAVVVSLLPMTIFGAAAADRFGTRPVLLGGLAATLLVAVVLGPMLRAGTWPLVLGISCLGFGAHGWISGAIAAFLSELFPTRVRCTGTAVSYNLAGILGGAGAPYLTHKLAMLGGVGYVGFYLAGTALLGAVAALAMRKATYEDDVSASR